MFFHLILLISSNFFLILISALNVYAIDNQKKNVSNNNSVLRLALHHKFMDYTDYNLLPIYSHCIWFFKAVVWRFLPTDTGCRFILS